MCGKCNVEIENCKSPNASAHNMLIECAKISCNHFSVGVIRCRLYLLFFFLGFFLLPKPTHTHTSYNSFMQILIFTSQNVCICIYGLSRMKIIICNIVYFMEIVGKVLFFTAIVRCCSCRVNFSRSLSFSLHSFIRSRCILAQSIYLKNYHHYRLKAQFM